MPQSTLATEGSRISPGPETFGFLFGCRNPAFMPTGSPSSSERWYQPGISQADRADPPPIRPKASLPPPAPGRASPRWHSFFVRLGRTITGDLVPEETAVLHERRSRERPRRGPPIGETLPVPRPTDGDQPSVFEPNGNRSETERVGRILGRLSGGADPFSGCGNPPCEIVGHDPPFSTGHDS